MLNDCSQRHQQLRLFPAPKPLVERLGVDFLRRVPDAPGVYLMADEFERLLYVGKAKSLRARLNSYRHVHPLCANQQVPEPRSQGFRSNRSVTKPRNL